MQPMIFPCGDLKREFVKLSILLSRNRSRFSTKDSQLGVEQLFVLQW